MDRLVKIMTSGPGKGAKHDDDFNDRLSHRYTVIVLVTFAILLGMTHYVGKPITCWAPKHFTGSHTKYTNSFCWVRNTYYMPWEDLHIPHESAERDYLPYYQWIPFILLGQAVLFYLPSVVWHGLNQKGGIDADNILASAGTFIHLRTSNKRDRTLHMITNQIHRFLTSRKGYIAGMHVNAALLKSLCSNRLGSYLVILFLISKLLYIANVVGQLFLLNNILSAEYNFYGFEVMGGMLQPDHDWAKSTSVVFPRVTMCDFRVRRLGNVHRYTVQCVLPINLYTEKIYVFLWFWMVFVAAASVLGFVVWLARTVMRGDKVTYVNSHLKAINKLNSETKGLVDGFIDEYLRQDGVFLLRLIGHNTNNITVTEIMGSLFDKYQEHVENELGTNKQKNQLGDLEDQPDTYPGDQGGLDAPDQAGPLPEKAPMLE